jgi:outer membrane protein OmpA-like peptidoglycan-associated protein
MIAGRPYAASVRIRGALLLLVIAALVTACGEDSKPPPAAPAATAAEESAEPPAEAASLPPGAQPGQDDYDGDGAPDPTCSTQDFGGGLVLRIPCHIGNAHDPENGTRLVQDSLYRLPSLEADLTGISGSLVTARDTAGARVVIVVFNSDNLFATGSDQVNESNTLDATIRLINTRFAGGAIQVRGHTDGTGSAAANQALSERRAATVRAYLTGHGVQSSAVTAIGFGSTRPLVEEANPEGRAFNRRVELAIRLP